MYRGVPCVAEYSNVCVEGTPAFGQPTIVRFDAGSACDGLPCTAGRCNRGPHIEKDGSRFPVERLVQEKRLLPMANDEVALLPSGLTNWRNPWYERAPGALSGPGATSNMAHLLYDSVLHEVDIARRQRVTVVLGDSTAARGKSIVHELRRRLLIGATFRPNVSGCFRKLYTYSWSCDRHCGRYAPAEDGRSSEGNSKSSSSKSSSSSHGGGGASDADATWMGSIRMLRRLAPFTPTPSSDPKLLILYGRTDSGRRRLLNLSLHFAALQERFRPPSWRVLNWDEHMAARPADRKPSVEEQIGLLRNAHILVTPHGAIPSVWGLLLRRGAAVYEIFSACMVRSWLKPDVMQALEIDHQYLASSAKSHMQADPRNRIKPRLVHPISKQPISGCPNNHANDPDLDISAEKLSAVVARLWESWGRRGRTGRRGGSG